MSYDRTSKQTSKQTDKQRLLLYLYTRFEIQLCPETKFSLISLLNINKETPVVLLSFLIKI